MIPALREEFNRNFTSAKYQSLLQSLDKISRDAYRVPRLRDSLLSS